MISDKFTVEDIHEVRYKNYERRKKMSPQEILEDIEKGAEEGRRIIEELRKKKLENDGQMQ